jgi:Ser/Thr protein kinase RdoA (MazF antagonist)
VHPLQGPPRRHQGVRLSTRAPLRPPLEAPRGDSRRGAPWAGATDVLRGVLADALTAAGVPFAGLEPLRPSGQVWRAFGAGAAWVVRVATAAEVPALDATRAWASALADRGVAVPRPWAPVGAPSALVRMGTSAALVTTWANGAPIAEVGWDETTAEALGALLGDTHAAAATLPWADGARRYDGAWADGAWRRLAIERVLPDVPGREATVVRAGLTAARVALERAWHGGPGGPVMMVHGDVHAHNVLRVDGDDDGVALALIDVGQAGLAPVLLDLAFALLEHQDATAWALWRGYRTRRSVPAEAEAALGAMHVLALVDNLGFLAADEREHAFVGEAWPALVASCAALLSGARAA